MVKKKIALEYMLNATTGNIIWSMVATPSGLARWFADSVDLQDKVYTFQWGKTESRDAKIVTQRQGEYLRLHWMDDEENDTYFEFRIDRDELTGDYMLEITDFADPGEENDLKELWDSQINMLQRTGGA